MEINEESYGRIARYLDGEDISLSSDELATVRQFRSDEQIATEHLGVPLPEAARARASRRMLAAAASGAGRSIRGKRVLGAFGVGVAVASAAAILLATFSLLWQPVLPSGATYNHVPTEEMINSLESDSDFDMEADLLAGMIETEEAEVVATNQLLSPAVDGGIDDLEEKINLFWEDDSWDTTNEG
jgi:hypothetical protein